MPAYRVYTTSNDAGLGAFTIEDDRDLDQIATELGVNGHLVTRDVTEHGGSRP
jgi:hypothetical protein